MRRFLTLFFLVPIAIIVIAISVANRGDLTIALDPIGDPPIWSVSAPTYRLLFTAFGLGGLLGGIATWLQQSKWRRTARIERAKTQRLQQEVELLHRKTRPAPLPSLVPPGPGSRDAA